MERIVGKAYQFKEHNGYYNCAIGWEVKKVVGFDSIGRTKTETLGAFFFKEKDAIEYCHWWNYKYFEKKKTIEEQVRNGFKRLYG